MDLSEKDKLEMDKSDGDHTNYQTPNISSEWRFGGTNLPTPQISLVPANHSISNLSTGSSVSMRDSLCPGFWDHRASQNTGFSENNHIRTSASANNVISVRKLVPDANWNPLTLALNRSVFLQSGAALLPRNLSQFPTDSAFIERAAGFPCFNGGNFSDMVMYPVGASEYMGPYSEGGGIQVAEVASDNGLKTVSGLQSQKGLNVAEVDTEVLPVVNLGGTKAGPMISEREDGSNSRPYDEGKHGIRASIIESDEAEFRSNSRPYDEGKHGIRASIIESDEAEFSGRRRDESLSLDNAVGETSTKEVSAKKRKRNSEDVESDEVIGALQLSVQTSKDSVEAKLQEEQDPNSAATKPAGKHVKDSSQNLDVPKEEYIHVRARRGQATNSHSLAERVRREKISERMKFLQDLVPGCSKVTGKAVMLDEIINYVQSLQRQVEFLSMKLAAVNPRLDFNIEELLLKNTLQARGGMLSTIGFTPDMGMSHLQLRPSHQGLIHPGIPGIGNPSEMLRRTLNSQFTPMSGFKEPTSQMANIWDEDLHNVMQMSFVTNVPSNSQELNGSHQSGHMKSEL